MKTYRRSEMKKKKIKINKKNLFCINKYGKLWVNIRSKCKIYWRLQLAAAAAKCFNYICTERFWTKKNVYLQIDAIVESLAMSGLRTNKHIYEIDLRTDTFLLHFRVDDRFACANLELYKEIRETHFLCTWLEANSVCWNRFVIILMPKLIKQRISC